MPESQHNHPDVGIPAAAICDAAPDGMVIVDRRGIILWVNLELEHLTGHTAVELLGPADADDSAAAADNG